MKFRILGKYWEFVRFKREDLPIVRDNEVQVSTSDAGACEEPWVKGKRIFVSKDLTDKDELDTILHEILHASNYTCFSEEFVSSLASDMARILYDQLGYRKVEHDEARESGGQEVADRPGAGPGNDGGDGFNGGEASSLPLSLE